MTEEQALRILTVAAVIAVVGVFRGPILRWWYRMGYRDWRNPQKDKPDE